MCWLENSMHVTKLSNISDPDIIQHPNMHKYINENLFLSINSRFKSIKPELWMKEGGDDEPKVAHVAGMSSKADLYSTSLKQMGIKKHNPPHISDFYMEPCTYDMFNTNWSSYSGNTRFDLGTNINRELQNLYMVGRGNKTKTGELMQRRTIILFWIQ